MKLVKISINISEKALAALDELVTDWNKDLNKMRPGRKNNITRADIIETGILDLYLRYNPENK